MAEDFALNIADSSIIKEMFPNQEVVKKEVFNYYDNEFESTPISVQEVNKEEMMSRTFQSQSVALAHTENTGNKLLKCNKIILGSRPNRISVDEDYMEKSFKPSQISFEELNNCCSNPNVVLQDIQSYLHKSRRFCESCSILFPEPSGYESHAQIYHPSQDTAIKQRQHKCPICEKQFVAAHVVRRHLKNIHKLNDAKLIESNNKKADSQNISSNNSTDLRNPCSHCKKTFDTQNSLIDHLYEILQMKRKETEIVPVLKSVLFKCNKCDIHFTSSQLAAYHAEHMEMLVNWKCAICSRIFKKEDELSHGRQHSVSNNFVVYNLGEVDVSKILFKCSKCATHFSECNFLYHYRDCGLEVTRSMHCKICDILIDYNLNTLHESENHMGLNHFTVIKTDVISDNPVKPTANQCQVRNKISELRKSVREVKVVLQRIDSSTLKAHNKSYTANISTTFKSPNSLISNPPEKMTISGNERVLKDKKGKSWRTRLTTIKKRKDTGRKYKINGNMKLDNILQVVNNKTPDSIHEQSLLKKRKLAFSYCATCKCFITKFRKSAHIQARCMNFPKTACKLCGLILTTASIATHRRLHEERKDLQLKNFRFYDLYNGRSINPSIPEYPKCVDCSVQFLSKTARNNHICSEELYLTCHICEMKLSEAAFKVHMPFHRYQKKGMKAVTSKYSQHSTTLDIQRNPKNATINEIVLHNSFDVVETPLQNDTSNTYEIVYTCGNCSVSVDSYDKVIEHSQDHYKNKENVSLTEVCDSCNLKIDKTCYADHYNLHEQGKELKLLKFDSYFLPAENDLWVKHIFKTLPNDKVLNILRHSIYRYERRIKMDVVQQGDPDLTVYKCDQCCCFIEPNALFKHSDNSCFKLRQHPCTQCGLPFISSASRIEHEKIHKRPAITVNSYRIVVFNREMDKQINRSFCLRKSYVLYKCRCCGVIIDNLHRDTHQCNVSDVKKCPDCGLLLDSKEYESHVKAHKEFVSFNSGNFKVILLGEDKSHNPRSEHTVKSNFKGAIYDYKIYICNKCEICIKNEKCMSKHICHFGKQRLKCLKCDLYFSVGRLKTHTRTHERDPDFLRSNMNIISFDPCTFDQNKNATLQITDYCELSDSNTDSDSDIVSAANDTPLSDNDTDKMQPIKVPTDTVMEETAKVYKCTCALHFLNEDSIFRHFGVCRSKTRIAKQKCPKCDLLFTPNVLFTHLLAHHSNKNRRYKYHIIEMDTTQKSSLQ